MKGLIALALAYILSQFYRSFLAVLTPQLSADLSAGKADLALASGIWFLTFALMQFAVGVGLDRFGPRRTAGIIFGVGATSGALVFASAQSPTAIVIAMGLFGIGCSPVLMASLFIFARRFDAGTFAMLTSWLVALGNTGNVIGASPLALAVDLYGWRTTMLMLAGITGLVSLGVYLLVQDPPQEKQESAGFRGYRQLIRIRALWPIMIMTLLCYAPVVSIRGLWAGPYLHDLHQADSVQIGTVTLYMAIAMIVGSLVYGPLDRLLGTRKWVVFTGNLLVLCALLMLSLSLSPVSSIHYATVLLIVIGLCGTSYGVVMAHGRSFLPTHLVGRGVTLFNFCSMFGAGTMQFASGRLMDAHAQPGSVHSYQMLFGFYALMLAIALIVYLGSHESHARH